MLQPKEILINLGCCRNVHQSSDSDIKTLFNGKPSWIVIINQVSLVIYVILSLHHWKSPWTTTNYNRHAIIKFSLSSWILYVKFWILMTRACRVLRSISIEWKNCKLMRFLNVANQLSWLKMPNLCLKNSAF